MDRKTTPTVCWNLQLGAILEYRIDALLVQCPVIPPSEARNPENQWSTDDKSRKECTLHPVHALVSDRRQPDDDREVQNDPLIEENTGAQIDDDVGQIVERSEHHQPPDSHHGCNRSKLTGKDQQVRKDEEHVEGYIRELRQSADDAQGRHPHAVIDHQQVMGLGFEHPAYSVCTQPHLGHAWIQLVGHMNRDGSQRDKFEQPRRIRAR
jgi:hypothetical protein